MVSATRSGGPLTAGRLHSDVLLVVHDPEPGRAVCRWCGLTLPWWALADAVRWHPAAGWQVVGEHLPPFSVWCAQQCPPIPTECDPPHADVMRGDGYRRAYQQAYNPGAPYPAALPPTGTLGSPVPAREL